MEEKIFLDNASTTRINSQVNDLIYRTNTEDFYNPSALYHESVLVKQKIEKASQDVAECLNVNPKGIIFTSGATEANNLAIMGSFTAKRGAEYIFSMGEHPSVYNVAKFLEQKGAIVHFVKLTKDGSVDIDQLKSLLNDNTHFVSIMFVSNETGAINDIKQISKIIKSYNKNIIFHVDGVQAFGKIKCDLKELGVDAFTMSAHKFEGPKGVGVLYYKNTSSLKVQMLGGGQQNALRSGTENISGILGLALACKIATQNLDDNYAKIQKCREIFVNKINQDLTGYDYKINQPNVCSPYVLSVSFKGLKAQVLMNMLDEKGVIVGTGSACSSKKQENRILQNMGVPLEYVKGSIRISFSSATTVEECEKASEILTQTVKELYAHIAK